MGQLLILRDEDVERREGMALEALGLFRAIARLEPVDRHAAGPLLAFKFPRRRGDSTPILRAADGSWLCAAGCWIRNGDGSIEALRDLRAAVSDPPRFEGLAEGFDGPFVIAGGGPRGDLVSVTDRTGSLHVYVARIGATLAVSTSSLVLAALARPQWDPTGLGEFLATGTIFERRTLFRGIEKLEPATVTRFGGEGPVRSRRYWSIGDVAYDGRRRGGTVDQLVRALTEGMSEVFAAYPRPLLDLTGGLDSRAVVGAALGGGRRPATVVNGPQRDPDVLAAGRIARSLGLDHRHQQLPDDWPRRWWPRAREALALCDGEYDMLEYAAVLDYHLRVCAAFDVSVNGSGGEFCKGYWWELLFPLTGRRHFDERRIAAARFAVDRWSDDLLQEPFPRGAVEHFAEVIRRTTRCLDGRPNIVKLDAVYLAMRMQRWQGRIASATSRVWPCLSPFMFRRPLEVALSAAPSTRLRNRMSRRLIERLDPRLAALPLAQGYPALPLRPSTMHRFGRLALELAGKAAGRLLPLPPATGGRAVPREPPPGAMLLDRDPVRDLLVPRSMTTRGLYRADRLDELLGRPPASPHEVAHRGRILTVECVAQTVAGRALC